MSSQLSCKVMENWRLLTRSKASSKETSTRTWLTVKLHNTYLNNGSWKAHGETISQLMSSITIGQQQFSILLNQVGRNAQRTGAANPRRRTRRQKHLLRLKLPLHWKQRSKRNRSSSTKSKRAYPSKNLMVHGNNLGRQTEMTGGILSENRKYKIHK